MIRQAKLETLSAEDQNRLLELCRSHTYTDVITIAAKPRDQGGLDLVTNRAALCRFASKKDRLPSASLDARIGEIIARHAGDTEWEQHQTSVALAQLIQEQIFATLLKKEEATLPLRELRLLLDLKRINHSARRELFAPV